MAERADIVENGLYEIAKRLLWLAMQIHFAPREAAESDLCDQRDLILKQMREADARLRSSPTWSEGGSLTPRDEKYDEHSTAISDARRLIAAAEIIDSLADGEVKTPERQNELERWFEARREYNEAKDSVCEIARALIAVIDGPKESK